MKIGIIGSGGAGTCAAYLLDQHHEIVMLERKDYLGGNTHTVDVELDGHQYTIDDGAAWFSPTIYPFFNRYQEMAGIKFDWLPLSLTYHNKKTNETTCMPPVELRRIIQMFSKSHVLPQLLALNKVVNKSMKLVEDHNGSITYREFMNGINLSDWKKENFLKPLLSGVWGAPHHLIDGFAMYPLMKYVVYHKPSGLKYFDWKIMTGGTKNYIKTVHDHLKNTIVKSNSDVLKVEPNKDSGKVEVTLEGAEKMEFDHVIATSGGKDTKNMIQESEGMEDARSALAPFEYYLATLATHSDPSLMPPNRKDWSVVNVINKGDHADPTIWHGWKTGADIFCSYLSPGDEPKNLHHISKWWLPCETPAFFAAQKELAKVQGKHNIWFGGDYTRDIGSHEDAIVSAIRAVSKIEPNSVRLKEMTHGLEQFVWGGETH